MVSASAAQAQHAGQQPLTPSGFAAQIRQTAQNKLPPKPPSLAN
jgi:hypothetical protein